MLCQLVHNDGFGESDKLDIIMKYSEFPSM